VVFEVLSPNNRFQEMLRKLRFYEKYGVEEYYLYDPDHNVLEGWRRTDNGLDEIPVMEGWTSPRLGVRFGLADTDLVLFGPDGTRFLSYQELADERDRLSHERDRLAHERDLVIHERDQIARERDAERQRAEQMAAQIRAMGLEPPPIP
jgi:hypothetical protein